MSVYRHIAAFLIFCAPLVLWISEVASADIDLSAIPRIDVHAHVGDIEKIENSESSSNDSTLLSNK